MADVDPNAPSVKVSTSGEPEKVATPEKFVTVSTKEEPDDVKSEIKAAAPVPSSTEAREVAALKNYVRIAKSTPVYSEASKVLHWRDPVKSGLLFGIVNFLFFLYAIFDYSLLTITAYVLLTLLTIAVGYANYVVLKAQWLQGQRVENPFQERFKDASFHGSRQTAERYLDLTLDAINSTSDLFRDVFYCTDNFLSARFFVYFYIAATIGNWFSGATIIYLVALVAFVWPRLYEEKKREIDQYAGIAQAQANTYAQLALSKLPPAVTAKFPALKPKNN